MLSPDGNRICNPENGKRGLLLDMRVSLANVSKLWKASFVNTGKQRITVNNSMRLIAKIGVKFRNRGFREDWTCANRHRLFVSFPEPAANERKMLRFIHLLHRAVAMHVDLRWAVVADHKHRFADSWSIAHRHWRTLGVSTADQGADIPHHLINDKANVDLMSTYGKPF
jgi:hypothetical protein